MRTRSPALSDRMRVLPRPRFRSSTLLASRVSGAPALAHWPQGAPGEVTNSCWGGLQTWAMLRVGGRLSGPFRAMGRVWCAAALSLWFCHSLLSRAGLGQQRQSRGTLPSGLVQTGVHCSIGWYPGMHDGLLTKNCLWPQLMHSMDYM